MDACECSGGARAGSLRPERHTGSLALRTGPLGNVVPSGPVTRCGERKENGGKKSGERKKKWLVNFIASRLQRIVLLCSQILVATFLEVIPTYLRLQGHLIK
ncbi:hypothetical protein NDU88_001524 [Pleurodeles waltl]|uniref:Uncharacterized protein n=1 Tax=Pleurodeles waltl TaxID=8319 RepID=A0AAV7V8Q0_PLEWA|nr:hypothetical protein NDU88_001524 [Pleurodeles waltl]